MPDSPLEFYLTTTNDGLQTNLQALCGGRIRIHDPVSSTFVTAQLGGGGIPTLQAVFNGTANVEDPTTKVITPGRSLVDGAPYYMGARLSGAGAVEMCYWRRGFTDPANRYHFQAGEGIPVYSDPAGSICTLTGMVLPIGGSILSVAGGVGARALTSAQPWGNVPPQPLTINSGQLGGTIQNATPAERQPNLGIYACSWAWRPAESRWSGRIANGASTAFGTAFIRPFARSLTSGAVYYGDTYIHQIAGAGMNTALSGDGVALALDDDALYFGMEFWTSAGELMSFNISHKVKAFI